MTNNGTNTSSKVRFRANWTLIFLVILGACILGLSSCSSQDTIWTTEAPAPDGRWVATASTVEISGFGTGDIETDVFLKWAKGSKGSEHILGFVHDPRSASKTINLSMTWVTPSHLDVTYDGHPTVDLQVVKYGDVDISLRDLSSVQKNNSQ
jgi:hypothetical protein